jgi:hypothetical protein
MVQARSVQFTVRRLMVLIAVVAFLIPVGTWARDMWYRRVSMLDRAARIAVNEQSARNFISAPNIAPKWHEYWTNYADQCARLRQHCNRAAARPWRDPGPDPR